MARGNTIPWKVLRVLLSQSTSPLTTPHPTTCEGLSAGCDACQPLGGAEIRDLEQPTEGVDQYIVPLSRVDTVFSGHQAGLLMAEPDPILGSHL